MTEHDRSRWRRRAGRRGAGPTRDRLAPGLEPLEERQMLTAVATLDGTNLNVVGGAGPDLITVDLSGPNLVVSDTGQTVGTFPNAAVTQINVDAGAGDDSVRIAANIKTATNLDGGPGNDRLTGGAGSDVLNGGDGVDTLFGGQGFNFYTGGEDQAALPGLNLDLDQGLFLDNQVTPTPTKGVYGGDPNPQPLTLKTDEVKLLLDRASAASPTNDGIIAVVDNSGQVLGVRVEAGVSPTILNDPVKLTFAIDGAVAEARTGAFFANNTAPLTSRTVQALSESTVIQREVESNPNITDPNSPLRGPGTVAPIGVAGHFPRGVNFTPQVDLAQIEHSNRDTTFNPGPDRIKGTADDVKLPNRFNVPDQFIPPRLRPENQVPGQVPQLYPKPPDSYGYYSGILPGAQPRGIGTLPGGLPIERVFTSDGKPGSKLQTVLVGGLGVFFPGDTGYADAENSQLNGLAFDPTKPDRSLEAEAVAIAALGGIVDVTKPGLNGPVVINNLGSPANPLPKISSIALPLGRIDLVGITLAIYGGHGLNGVSSVQHTMQALGIRQNSSLGTVSGSLAEVDPGPDGIPNTADDIYLKPGFVVPEGFLVTPHDAADGSLTKDDVIRITAQSVVQANQTRAAIRLPLDESSRMVIAVTDKDGNVLGLYRMPGATYFSIDISVAKARNVAYYANPQELQPVDQVPGVPPGTAITNRTIRYLALPHLPEGQDTYPPGPFSILNDGQTAGVSALNATAPLPASAFQSVNGYDAMNPQTNFHDPNNILNQNGIVFFPGSAPLYKDTNGDGVRELVGGFGISGDGVDQDDVVTYFGAQGYEPPLTVPRADQTFYKGIIRLPYIKFNRQPLNRQFEIPQPFPTLSGISTIASGGSAVPGRRVRARLLAAQPTA